MLAKKDPRVLLLNREAFDALVKERLQRVRTQGHVASLLEIKQSVWSLYRTQKRVLNASVLAAAMDLFPGVPPQAYTVNKRLSEVEGPLQ